MKNHTLRLHPSSLRAHGIFKEIFIAQSDTLFELRLICPPQSGRFADVEKLSRRAVRAGGIPLDATLIADHLSDELGKGLDRKLLAGACCIPALALSLLIYRLLLIRLLRQQAHLIILQSLYD